MKKNERKIFACYFDYDEKRDAYTFHLTDDENEARKLDSNYRLATLDELNEWARISNYPFDDGACILKEGKFVWVSGEYLDRFGEEEYFFELVKVA